MTSRWCAVASFALALGASAIGCDQVFGIRFGHARAVASSASGAGGTIGSGGAGGGDAGGGGADGGCTGDACCANDCLGGACEAGVCQPVVIARGLAAPAGIAVSDGFVDWIEQGTLANDGDDGRVMRAPVACSSDAGASCGQPIATNRPELAAIVAAMGQVFWAEQSNGEDTPNTGTIWQWTASTGARVAFATDQNRPRALALDLAGDASLVWGNEGVADADGEIRRRFLTAGAPNGASIVAKQEAPLAIVADQADLFFTDYGLDDESGSVVHAAIDGTSVHTIASSQGNPHGVAVTSSSVYWVDYADGTLMRADRDGAHAKTLLSNLNHPTAIVADDGWLFFSEAGTADQFVDGRVSAMNLATSDVTVLASAQIYAYAVAVDHDALYWVARGTLGADAFDGVVAKIARP